MAPRLSWGLAVLAAGLLTAAVMALGLGHYARKASVQGWLIPDRGLIRIQAQEHGTVERLHVAEGDEVEAGAPLLTIARDIELENGANFWTLRLAHLSEEHEELSLRLELAARKYDAELEAAARQRVTLAAELTSLARQSAMHVKRVALAELLASRYDALAKQGFVAELEQIERRENLMALRLTAEQLAQGQLRLETELTVLDGRRARLVYERDERLAELRGLLTNNAERRADAARQGRVVVASPVAGRVASVAIHAGQALGPQTLELTLLPRHARLHAELFVPSRAAGFIAPGQEVRLLYDAFPHQKFGTGAGRVRQISRAVVSPRDLAVELGIREPVYRVAVALDREHVDAYGARQPLQAGMTLRADIVLERRRLWEWLLDPLLASLAR